MFLNASHVLAFAVAVFAASCGYFPFRLVTERPIATEAVD